MFITNNSVIAGATSSGPLCRPQALNTTVKATTPTAMKLIQNAAPSGSAKIEPGMSTMAAMRARRQLAGVGIHQVAATGGPVGSSAVISLQLSGPGRAIPGEEGRGPHGSPPGF